MEISNVIYKPNQESLIAENAFRRIVPKSIKKTRIRTQGNVVQGNANYTVQTGITATPGETFEFHIEQSADNEHFIDFSKSHVLLKYTMSTTDLYNSFAGVKLQRGSGSIFNKVSLLTKNGVPLQEMNDYHLIESVDIGIHRNQTRSYAEGCGNSMSGFSYGTYQESSSTGQTLFISTNITRANALSRSAAILTDTTTTATCYSTHKFKSSLFGKYATKWIPLHNTKGYIISCVVNNFAGAFINTSNTGSYNAYTIEVEPMFFLKTYGVKRDLIGSVLRSSALGSTITIPFISVHTYKKSIDITQCQDFTIELPMYLKHIKSAIFGFHQNVEGNTSPFNTTGSNIGIVDTQNQDNALWFFGNTIGTFKGFSGSNANGHPSFSLYKNGTPTGALLSYNFLLNNNPIMEQDIIIQPRNSTQNTKTVSGLSTQELYLEDALNIDGYNKTILGGNYEQPLSLGLNSPLISIGPQVNNLYGMKFHDIDNSTPPSIAIKLSFALYENTAYCCSDELVVFFLCQNQYYLNLDNGESGTEF
jgi:hypothetical protein